MQGAGRKTLRQDYRWQRGDDERRHIQRNEMQAKAYGRACIVEVDRVHAQHALAAEAGAAARFEPQKRVRAGVDGEGGWACEAAQLRRRDAALRVAAGLQQRVDVASVPAALPAAEGRIAQEHLRLTNTCAVISLRTTYA